MTQLPVSGIETARQQMNDWGGRGIPFLFVLDFELNAPLVVPLSDVNPDEICYNLCGTGNVSAADKQLHDPVFESYPMAFEDYLTAFNRVQYHLHAGDTYLLNLTFPTPIVANVTTRELFDVARAPYRLWIKDHFVVFSPECFVRINNGVIASYPMKGTISALVPGAESLLLNNPKEKAEHATIVDLIRNDLSMVSSEVRVARFRYVDTIQTHNGPLLQTSSHISGQLPPYYAGIIGDILCQLLPAGSISGAPKQKTVEIIKAAEQQKRGYYTGVFGIFDGKDLDSAVMIRFIEEIPAGLLFRSGGGITASSRAEAEYRELIQKVYLPFYPVYNQVITK